MLVEERTPFHGRTAAMLLWCLTAGFGLVDVLAVPALVAALTQSVKAIDLSVIGSSLTVLAALAWIAVMGLTGAVHARSHGSTSSWRLLVTTFKIEGFLFGIESAGMLLAILLGAH